MRRWNGWCRAHSLVMVIRIHLRRLRPLLLRVVADGMILAGLAGLIYWGWSNGEAMVYQYVQRKQFDTAMAAAASPDTPVPAMPSEPSMPVAPQPSRSKLSLFMAPDPLLIGRLEAPALNLSVMLREGIDEDTLRKAAGHLPSSALPGEPGNFVVLGHRDTFFRPLRNVERGNQLSIVTPHGRFKYIVDSFEVTDPESVRIAGGGPDRTLTLVTCFPFRYIGPAPKRLVVHARLAAGTGAD